MANESKNVFGFLGDKFSELVHTIVSLGFRQLGNFTLLIRLPGTASNGQSARQLEIFTKIPLKSSFKFLKRGCQHPSNKFGILWQVAQNSFSPLLSYFVAQYVLIIVV